MSFRRRTPIVDLTAAREHLLRLQARREHSAQELRQRLRETGFDREQAEILIETLQDQGLQSDARYAELLVRSRVAQGYGPRRIEAEAGQAGIDASLLAAAIDAADIDWDAVLFELQQRRFRAAPGNRDEAQRQARYLLGRGFDAERVWRLLRERED